MGDYQNGRARNLLHVLLLLRTSNHLHTASIFLRRYSYAAIPPPRSSRAARKPPGAMPPDIMVVDYRDSLADLGGGGGSGGGGSSGSGGGGGGAARAGCGVMYMSAG